MTEWIDARHILPEEDGIYLTCHEISGVTKRAFITAVLYFNTKSGRFNDSDGSGTYSLPVDYWSVIDPPEDEVEMH